MKSSDTSRRNFLKNGFKWMSALSIAGAGVSCGEKEESAEKENPYEYDLSKLKKVDPKYLTWKESKRIPLTGNELRALAVSKEHIAVSVDKEIRIFDLDGQVQKSWAVDSPVGCLSISRNGHIYAGMIDHIEVFELDGSLLSRWDALDREAILTSVLVVDSYVFAADAGHKVIHQFNMDGVHIRQIASTNPDTPKGFIVPSPYFDIATGHEGNIWVVNPGQHKLENYTPEGRFLSAWGETSWQLHGFSGCCNPTHLTILSDGRFVTSEKGLARVKVFRPDGKLESVVVAPDEFDETTVGLDLAVLETKVFVLDTKAEAVRVFVEA